MTDQQAYTDRNGDKMTLYGDRVGGGVLDIYAPRSVVIPAAELLAMIDRAAPDAMRAYLRETAPEVIADLYRPAPAAAEHLDAVPEADSPEDTDERPGLDMFAWEDPPALNSPGSRPARYWEGITIMLRSRRGTWAKIGENVNPDSYRRNLRQRGCEVTTRNRREDGNRCDVYARFDSKGGTR